MSRCSYNYQAALFLLLSFRNSSFELNDPSIHIWVLAHKCSIEGERFTDIHSFFMDIVRLRSIIRVICYACRPYRLILVSIGHRLVYECMWSSTRKWWCCRLNVHSFLIHFFHHVIESGAENFAEKILLCSTPPLLIQNMILSQNNKILVLKLL